MHACHSTVSTDGSHELDIVILIYHLPRPLCTLAPSLQHQCRLSVVAFYVEICYFVIMSCMQSLS